MSGQQIELDIFEASVAALNQYLKDFFPSVDIPVILQPGRMYLRALARQKRVVKYPFIATTMNALQPTTDGYNNFALRFKGFRGSLNKTNDFGYRYLMKNVSANFSIEFFTNDYNDMIKFSKNWLLGEGTLQFKLQQDGNTEIGVTVLRNQDITYPQEQIEEVGEFFQLQTSCDMRTYIGYGVKDPVIKKVNLQLSVINIQGKPGENC